MSAHSDSSPSDASSHDPRLLPLSLAALGVVFGDIGTSPLYAMRECFSGLGGLTPSAENVLGVLSLITWALIISIPLWLILGIVFARSMK